MDIEKDIFKRYLPNFDKLKQFGFKKDKDIFILEQLFKDNSFRAVIKIEPSVNKISSTVYDLENDDEFLPLRVEGNQGAFVGEVRKAYIELLEKIRDNCFIKQCFVYPQSNRITNILKEELKSEPEFLWEKFPGSGIFRNPKTNKWYLAILDVDHSKIQKDKKGLIEVADIKLPNEKVEKLLKTENYYPAYHMNKKSWITIILNDSVPDKKVMELVKESYHLTGK